MFPEADQAHAQSQSRDRKGRKSRENKIRYISVPPTSRRVKISPDPTSGNAAKP